MTTTRSRWPEWVDGAVLVGLAGSGLGCPYGIGRWYLALGVALVGIAAPLLLVAGIVTYFAERAPRLQGPRTRSALIARGVRDTALAAFVAAALLAWPLAKMWSGAKTGLVWTLGEAGGGWRVAISNALAVLVLDAWLYWKHRILHTRWLFAFHREHHVYRDPTPFSSFAVGPVESLLTFWPIVLVALPEAPHYAPVYFGLVGGFVTLNLYLHSGVRIALAEKLLTPLYVNTSVFHNRHHANAEVNFGEALTVWDKLMATSERRG